MDAYRRDLLTIYQAAIDAVNGRVCVRQFLQESGSSHLGQVSVVAIGKAAEAMLQGVTDALGDRIHQGLLITKRGHAEPGQWTGLPIHVHFAGHPVPDETSLVAGQALLHFIEEQPEDIPLLFLISGGASALVEVLAGDLTLPDLIKINDWLLSSGLGIARMNALRQRLSVIKGGGLLQFLQGHPVAGLLISDVPGDDPSVIGSGLLVEQDAASLDMPVGLPAWIAQCIPEQGKKSSSVSPDLAIVATLDMALDAAVLEAERLGYPTVRQGGALADETVEMAEIVSGYLKKAQPGIFIWGGETSVTLPVMHGLGGRNQHFALQIAHDIAGCRELLLLAMGTDGTDGPTEDAGAIVDGQTVARGELEGLNIHDSLRQANSSPFLESSGDLVHTGPTGTNVMDIVIGLKLHPENT